MILIEPSEDLAAPGLKALTHKGYDVTFIEGDVTNAGRMEEIATSLSEQDVVVSILINNAGVGQSGVAAEDVNPADWLNIMNVNVNGVFWCSRAFGRHMISAGRGAIVNIGSMSGNVCNRPQPQTPYNVSKAAVHHMTRSMAAEWAQHGVRVNAVAPTYIETPMVLNVDENKTRIPIWLNDTPMGRMGQSHEVASAVLFLASEASSLMTGAIVNVDGGVTCW